MKRSVLFSSLVLFFGILFSNFQKAPAGAPINLTADLDLEVFVPCANNGAGEVVKLTGPLHILIVSNINGQNITGVSHFQPMGVQGTGQTTGMLYTATGITFDQFSGSLVNGLYTETFINNFRIIGQGPGNNLQIHQTFHVTFSANGDAVASVDNTSVDCN